jgi:hypothetical protein
MTESTYAMSDVERLTVILDDVISEWTDQDKAVMHDLLARAGQSYGLPDDEVSGFSFSWGAAQGLPAVQTPSTGGLFNSFQMGFGVGHGLGPDSSPASRVELNPQPLPP